MVSSYTGRGLLSSKYYITITIIIKNTNEIINKKIARSNFILPILIKHFNMYLFLFTIVVSNNREDKITSSREINKSVPDVINSIKRDD